MTRKRKNAKSIAEAVAAFEKYAPEWMVRKAARRCDPLYDHDHDHTKCHVPELKVP